MLATLSAAFGSAFQYGYNIAVVNTPHKVGTGGCAAAVSSSRRLPSSPSAPLDSRFWRPGHGWGGCSLDCHPFQAHWATAWGWGYLRSLPSCFAPLPFRWEGHLQMTKRIGGQGLNPGAFKDGDWGWGKQRKGRRRPGQVRAN